LFEHDFRKCRPIAPASMRVRAATAGPSLSGLLHDGPGVVDRRIFTGPRRSTSFEPLLRPRFVASIARYEKQGPSDRLSHISNGPPTRGRTDRVPARNGVFTLIKRANSITSTSVFMTLCRRATVRFGFSRTLPKQETLLNNQRAGAMASEAFHIRPGFLPVAGLRAERAQVAGALL